MTWTYEQSDQLLFNYQKRILEDPARYILLEKSRRIGGTFIFAFKTILECIQNDWNGWFSSNDYTNGLEFIRYVKEWAGVINAVLGTEYIDLSLATTEKVELPNGKRITTLSSSPAALRGKDGIIILDEVASRDDQQELMTAAQGCLIQKGKLYLLSTHNGPSTVFFNIANAAPANGWSKHKVTLMDALDDGYAVRFAKHYAHLGTKEAINEAFVKEIKQITLNDAQYRQEYLCEPLSLQSLVRPEDYDAVALWDVDDQLDANHVYNPLHIGIDVGRTHDKTVVWIAEEWENVKATNEWDRYDYKTVCVRTIHNMTIPEQWEIIAPILSHPSVSTMSIDQGTVGRSLADLVQEHYPFAKLLTFTAPLKAKMAERINGFVQYKRLSMPKNRSEIREDILAMRRQVSKTGNVIYDGSTKDSHCDHFWAAAMALESAMTASTVKMVG